METFLSEHDPVLSCMGFFEPQYRFDLAVQAIKSLKATYPESGLVIMASGEQNGSPLPVMEDLDEEDILVLKDMEKTTCLGSIPKFGVSETDRLRRGRDIGPGSHRHGHPRGCQFRRNPTGRNRPVQTGRWE